MLRTLAPIAAAAVLTVASCAAAVAVSAAVTRSLDGAVCRAEAAAALISAEHCALR